MKEKSKFPTEIGECYKIVDTQLDINYVVGKYEDQLGYLQNLLICRNAWWKIDNNYKPNYKRDTLKYSICCVKGEVSADCTTFDISAILTFRTASIRNKFYETFKYLIEECKELI